MVFFKGVDAVRYTMKDLEAMKIVTESDEKTGIFNSSVLQNRRKIYFSSVNFDEDGRFRDGVVNLEKIKHGKRNYYKKSVNELRIYGKTDAEICDEIVGFISDELMEDEEGFHKFMDWFKKYISQLRSSDFEFPSSWESHGYSDVEGDKENKVGFGTELSDTMGYLNAQNVLKGINCYFNGLSEYEEEKCIYDGKIKMIVYISNRLSFYDTAIKVKYGPGLLGYSNGSIKLINVEFRLNNADKFNIGEIREYVSAVKEWLSIKCIKESNKEPGLFVGWDGFSYSPQAINNRIGNNLFGRISELHSEFCKNNFYEIAIMTDKIIEEFAHIKWSDTVEEDVRNVLTSACSYIKRNREQIINYVTLWGEYIRKCFISREYIPVLE